MNNFINTIQITLLFITLAFLVMYFDYFLIRPYAVDYHSTYIIELNFQNFFFTTYLKSLFIIFLGASFHFFIVTFLFNVYSYNRVSKKLVFNSIILSKIIYVLPWLIKFIYFKFFNPSYNLNQVVNFTRFTLADLFGSNNMLINSIIISDVFFL